MTPSERPHRCHRLNCRRCRRRHGLVTVPILVALIQLLSAVLHLFGG